MLVSSGALSELGSGNRISGIFDRPWVERVRRRGVFVLGGKVGSCVEFEVLLTCSWEIGMSI
jgi:hypothetical protein